MTSAVPKSGCFIINAMGMKVKRREIPISNSPRPYFLYLRNLARVRTRVIFMNSEG